MVIRAQGLYGFEGTGVRLSRLYFRLHLDMKQLRNPLHRPSRIPSRKRNREQILFLKKGSWPQATVYSVLWKAGYKQPK